MAALPPPSGSIATARWQHYHRAVYDEMMYVCKRHDDHLQTVRRSFANSKTFFKNQNSMGTIIFRALLVKVAITMHLTEEPQT